MSDDKVSVKEAFKRLYDLSWLVGSTAIEYLTDKDGEKIRDYIGVIEDRIDDLETELSSFKEAFGDPFKPCDVNEANQTDIENGQAATHYQANLIDIYNHDTTDCMKFIKKKYPWIPIFVIRRVLFAEELYMHHKIGIIDWEPDLKGWHFKE